MLDILMTKEDVVCFEAMLHGLQKAGSGHIVSDIQNKMEEIRCDPQSGEYKSNLSEIKMFAKINKTANFVPVMLISCPSFVSQ